MKKLLVTGASGFLGWNLCMRALTRWAVTGVTCAHEAALDGVTMLRCDLTDFTALERLFQNVQPDAVIHAAAAADPNFCETHPEISRQINVDAALRIAQMCAAYDARCVFISTDLLFDGQHPPYDEASKAAPLSLYGKQKAEAENRMRQAYAAMLICRMSLMYGDAPAQAKSFLQPMIQNLSDNKDLTLFTDEIRTPVSASDAACGILMLLESARSGIFHLGGKVRISRYEFGNVLSSCLGITHAPIIAAARKDVSMAAPRPADVSLDSAKASALGYNPLPPQAALMELSCVQQARQRVLNRK
jgi:dTDP-4-dehydrorhamnose reductase